MKVGHGITTTSSALPDERDEAQCHGSAAGLIHMPVNIPPQKTKYPVYALLYSFMVHGEYKGSRKVGGLFVWGCEGEMFEIGCGYNSLGWFLLTIRNLSSAFP